MAKLFPTEKALEVTPNNLNINDLERTMNFIGTFDDLESVPNAKRGDVAVIVSTGGEYIFTGERWELFGLYEDTPPEQETPPEVETIFSCPHCGGNQMEFKHGKKVCAFCGSEIVKTQAERQIK